MQEPSTGQNCLNVSGNLSGSIRSTRRSASHRLYLTVTLRFCTCRSPCTTNGIFPFCGRLQQRGDIFCQASQHVCKRIVKTGDEKDFAEALPIFRLIYDSGTDTDAQKEAACVLAHAYRIAGDINRFFQMTLRDMLSTPCAEICLELGAYFEEAEDYEEASLWYYNAAHETSSILDVHTGGDLPLQGLIRCYEIMLAALPEDDPFAALTANQYEEALADARKHSPTGMCRKNYNSLRSVLLQSATASVCGKNRTFLPQSDCAALDRCDNAACFFHDQRSRRKVPRTRRSSKYNSARPGCYAAQIDRCGAASPHIQRFLKVCVSHLK